MKLRPSALPVIARCNAAASLPEVVEAPTDDMAAGTARHAKADKSKAMEALVMAGFSEAATMVFEMETPVRMLLGSGMVDGTPDAVARTGPPGDVIILDWKGPHDDWDPTEQLMAYAYARAQTETTWTVVARLNDDMEILSVHRQDHSRAELDLWAERLARHLQSPPAYNIGDHCQRCTSFRVCPAQTQHLGGLMTLDHHGLTPLMAGTAWEKVKLYEKAIEAAKETLREMARAAPIQLPNGKVLAVVEMPYESIDADKALVFPDLEVKRSVTKESVTQAQLVQLRLAGATRTKITKQVREVKLP